MSLDEVTRDAWAEWDRARLDAKDQAYIPAESAPVLWFGDLERYLRSPVKVLTLGVNPGPKTFPEQDPWVKFPDIRGDRSLGAMTSACKAYPMDSWFSYWEPLIKPMGAALKQPADSQALHLDLTPLMTRPVFSEVPEEVRERLRHNGIKILVKLLKVLEPDCTVACLSGTHFIASQVQLGLKTQEKFPDLDAWRCTWGHSGKFLWVRKTNELPVPHKSEVKLEIGRWAASWS